MLKNINLKVHVPLPLLVFPSPREVVWPPYMEMFRCYLLLSLRSSNFYYQEKGISLFKDHRNQRIGC